MSRRIIHVDMDAFYASVEQRDDKSLSGKPVAVGGRSKRGVVMAASYEARSFGIHSAMPVARAINLCPQLLTVRPRFEVYREVSTCIRNIFLRHTPMIETLSLDEAYLDVTEACRQGVFAVDIAKIIKREIRDELDLTASAGVSFNKFLAKVASGWQKPDGLTVVREDQALNFIADLPIEAFHGVGPATALRLRQKGIYKGADVQAFNELELAHHFGRLGRYLYRIASAEDDRPVSATRERKSLSVERTFDDFLNDNLALEGAVRSLCDELFERTENAQFFGRTLTLKIRDHRFRTTTRSQTREYREFRKDDLINQAIGLLHHPFTPAEAIRLVGLGVSNPGYSDNRRQLSLEFEEGSE